MFYNIAMSTLNKDLLQQTLRGYAEVNEITAAERQAALENMTSAESWAIFDVLYTTWKRLGQKAGGDWDALEEQRLADMIEYRQKFEMFAKRKGSI